MKKIHRFVGFFIDSVRSLIPWSVWDTKPYDTILSFFHIKFNIGCFIEGVDRKIIFYFHLAVTWLPSFQKYTYLYSFVPKSSRLLTSKSCSKPFSFLGWKRITSVGKTVDNHCTFDFEEQHKKPKKILCKKFAQAGGYHSYNLYILTQKITEHFSSP